MYCYILPYTTYSGNFSHVAYTGTFLSCVDRSININQGVCLLRQFCRHDPFGLYNTRILNGNNEPTTQIPTRHNQSNALLSNKATIMNFGTGWQCQWLTSCCVYMLNLRSQDHSGMRSTICGGLVAGPTSCTVDQQHTHRSSRYVFWQRTLILVCYNRIQKPTSRKFDRRHLCPQTVWLLGINCLSRPWWLCRLQKLSACSLGLWLMNYVEIVTGSSRSA